MKRTKKTKKQKSKTTYCTGDTTDYTEIEWHDTNPQNDVERWYSNR